MRTGHRTVSRGRGGGRRRTLVGGRVTVGSIMFVTLRHDPLAPCHPHECTWGKGEARQSVAGIRTPILVRVTTSWPSCG
ncbi:hypothetical protein Shyd_52500 [Streptomyces hydrogenans]|uniref:Uncharacterized protein n=1 Tax=Streptomyces hydrogenans TaxID=1873719 RepID=A0ABQ3PFU9_9ACTN|nr:hypothetical protein Shyd_52500 [Streptomyces hydrogenans]